MLDLLKFLAVGPLGTITNLIFFIFFVDIMEGDINTGPASAFIFAAGQNYLSNHLWTFTSQMSDSPVFIQDYIIFQSTMESNYPGIGYSRRNGI